MRQLMPGRAPRFSEHQGHDANAGRRVPKRPPMTDHKRPDDIEPSVFGRYLRRNSAGMVWMARWTALSVVLAAVIVAVLLYLRFDSRVSFRPSEQSATNEGRHAASQEQIATMAAALSTRLKDKKDDVEGWTVLARSYVMLGRYAEAADAYSHLVTLSPGNAGLLADYADTMAMSKNKSLLGEPQKVIARALALDPKNIKALALSASASFQERDYPAAVGQWKKILVLVPPDSEVARTTMSSIGEAQNLAEQASKSELPRSPEAHSTPAQVVAGQAGTDIGNTEVSGTVQLDAGLRSKVLDTDTVFIFVRAVEGPSFPLAVLRKQVKDLPTSFVLGDQLSVQPYAKMSTYSSVIVGARVSRSGNATPGASDLEGQSEPVRPGAKNLVIRINRQRS